MEEFTQKDRDDIRELWQHVKKKTVVASDVPDEPKVVELEQYLGQPLVGKTLVLHYNKVPKFECDKPWACISMTWHKKNPKTILELVTFKDSRWCIGYQHPEASCDNRIEYLKFECSDARANRGPCPFLKKHAKQIKDFLDRNWDDIDVLVIASGPCGPAKALGVAHAICDHYHPGQSKYYQAPNLYVRDLLLEELTTVPESVEQ